MIVGKAYTSFQASSKSNPRSPSSTTTASSPSSSPRSPSSAYSSSDYTSPNLYESMGRDTASAWADNYERASASEKQEFDQKFREQTGVTGDDLRHMIREMEGWKPRR